MPRIAEFYGIAIYMYHQDHSPPHFHAIYGGARAQVEIDSLRILRGRLPGRAQAMVLEWAALHKDELLENWRLGERRGSFQRIKPLD